MRPRTDAKSKNARNNILGAIVDWDSDSSAHLIYHTRCTLPSALLQSRQKEEKPCSKVQKDFIQSKKRRKHYEQIAKADRVTRCENQKESSKCQRSKKEEL